MNKQKIIGFIVILVVFAAMIVLGLRGLPKEKEGGPETSGTTETPETPGAEGLPAASTEPITEPSGMPAPEFVGGPVPGPAELVGPPGEPAAEVIPGEPITEPVGPSEGPVGGTIPEEPITEPIAEEPQIPAWQNPEEPYQSPPLEASEVPKGAVEITITAEGISPPSFKVEKGGKVVLTVTSGDQWTHVFKFKDKGLEEVAAGVSSGQTRAITFYAPSKAGDYEYYCDVPGHEARGEIGKMLVK